MSRDSKIILVLVALGIIVIGGFATMFAVADNLVSPSGDVEYDYSYYTTPSFVSKSGYVETPQSGYTYLIVEVRAKNIGYDSGLSTNDIIWQWKAQVNGLEYSTSIDQYSHPKDVGSVDVIPGYSVDFVRVFKIPADVDVSTVKVTNEYCMFGPPKLIFNPDLI